MITQYSRDAQPQLQVMSIPIALPSLMKSLYLGGMMARSDHSKLRAQPHFGKLIMLIKMESLPFA